MCQREKCSPKSQGGAHYPEWEHCKLIGFAPDQETELFPEAVTGRSTKINVPLLNTIKCLPLQKTPHHHQPLWPHPSFFPPHWDICYCCRRLCPPFFFSCFFFPSSKQPVKVKGWHFLSKGAICSGENETCMVSRAGPAVGQGQRGFQINHMDCTPWGYSLRSNCQGALCNVFSPWGKTL